MSNILYGRESFAVAEPYREPKTATPDKKKYAKTLIKNMRDEGLTTQQIIDQVSVQRSEIIDAHGPGMPGYILEELGVESEGGDFPMLPVAIAGAAAVAIFAMTR